MTIASTLRAYLRYRATCGDAVQPLLAVIASPVHWSMASLPRGLKPEEVERLLNSFTDALPSPRRGYAVVRLALDLGLRGIVGPLTVDLMADWARQVNAGHGDRATLARRLKMLRPFTAWLRQFDPATEVPDEAVFGRVPGRMTPHIYRESEIVELLGAARQLGPEGALRPAVMETLFGLVACTGLRISEAQGLMDADVDLRAGVLTIRQSKFGKTRLVLLHPSAVDALTRYRTLRSRHVRVTPELPFFVASRGQLLGHALGDRQVHRVFGDLRRQLGWVDRGSHGTPRIHDLRHSFAVRRLVLWHEQGEDINQRMLALSTYLGHVKVSSTYWYLTGVPELLGLLGQAFERYASPWEDGDE